MRRRITLLEQDADQKADDAAEHRPRERNKEELTAEAAAVAADRKEAQADDAGLEPRRDDGADGTSDYSNEDVTHAQTHQVIILTSKDNVLDDRAAFEAFAGDFGATLRPGDVVGLRGPLGAGKTTFVRAIVRRLHGSDAAVSSPTFIFRQRYDGAPPVEHVDLYRIDDPIREPAELGLEEAFSSDGIALIEWPERGGSWIPVERIDVAIEGVGDGPRRVRIVRPA